MAGVPYHNPGWQMYSIPKSTRKEICDPGTWRIFEWGTRWVVSVSCPGCAEPARLDHVVSRGGEVSPSLNCSLCDFHEFVKLDGWGGQSVNFHTNSRVN